MQKALIGAAKMTVTLGALALVIAFLGMYLAPVVAQGSGNGGPTFWGNITTNNSQQFTPTSQYGFQITIGNSTGGALGNVSYVIFQFGNITGSNTNFTNSTTSPYGIVVRNDTQGTFYINFTQDQMLWINGPALAFNYTWFANATGNSWNYTDTIRYREPTYNLRPYVRFYGNSSNITKATVLNWGNQRTKYYSWVPMMKFNLTSKQPYLPSSDAYAEAMYYDVPFFANPSAIEMLAYNFTINLTFASQVYNQTFVVSITPRVIRSGQDVLSGAETPLMPAWSVQDTQSFQGESVSRTILRPTMNTLYYSYNGTVCGPYNTDSIIGPGGDPRAVFYNTTLLPPCNYNISYDYTNNEMNLTLPNANVSNPVVSVLFALAGRPTSGMYSPIYLVNQTFIGGFVPGPGREPPAPGAESTISFMVRVNNSLSNFTSTNGTDMFVHFLYPKNVTVWDNSSTSDMNISVNMGSNFQLWQLNDTVNAAVAGAINATASNDVNTSTGRVWMMIANVTALWNTSVSAYNNSLPNLQNFIVNRTFSCNNVTESFSGSPSNGKNITICFQEFDFNLTSINSWLPNDPKSNVTLNLTATLNVSILNAVTVGSGGAGTTNQFNASVSTASAGEIKFNETQMPGFTSGNCGADFSGCSKTIIVDGSPLNSSAYRTGSIILNLASGTHAVSVTYTVPAAAAAATTATTDTGGSSSTISVDVAAKKTIKTFTSITQTTPRSIYETELRDTETGLTQIDISVKNLATSVKIIVEKLAGKPASITQEVIAGNGKVYKFMNISKENLADNNIDKVMIKFKVEKNWLTVNGFNASNIVMKRYTSQWDKLNTTKTTEDSTYVYYTAVTPGFSVFAVAADKSVAVSEQPSVPQQEPAQEPQQELVAAPADMTVVYGLIVAVIVIGGLLYFTKIRKGKKSDKKRSSEK